MKSHCRVAIIGGGVVGASVLYHLTKIGWTDAVATLVATLRSKGHEIVPADGVEGWYRVHVFDPFGNRIELMEPLD